MKLKYYCFLFLFLLANCKFLNVEKNREIFALITEEQERDIIQAKKSLLFLEYKLKTDSSNNDYLIKIGNVNEQLFLLTNKRKYLKKAEYYFLLANTKSSYTNVGFIKELSHNYILQNQFNKAINTLLLIDKDSYYADYTALKTEIETYVGYMDEKES